MFWGRSNRRFRAVKTGVVRLVVALFVAFGTMDASDSNDKKQDARFVSPSTNEPLTSITTTLLR